MGRGLKTSPQEQSPGHSHPAGPPSPWKGSRCRWKINRVQCPRRCSKPSSGKHIKGSMGQNEIRVCTCKRLHWDREQWHSQTRQADQFSGVEAKSACAACKVARQGSAADSPLSRRGLSGNMGERIPIPHSEYHASLKVRPNRKITPHMIFQGAHNINLTPQNKPELRLSARQTRLVHPMQHTMDILN